jgi:hypothetical protein
MTARTFRPLPQYGTRRQSPYIMMLEIRSTTFLAIATGRGSHRLRAAAYRACMTLLHLSLHGKQSQQLVLSTLSRIIQPRRISAFPQVSLKCREERISNVALRVG